MRINKLILALIITAFASNAFAKKPPKPPTAARDLDCVECVDTTDVADGAVTSEKLSSDLQGALGQKTIVVLDANDNQVGLLLNAFSTSSATVIIESDGELAQIRINKDGYIQSNDFAYT